MGNKEKQFETPYSYYEVLKWLRDMKLKCRKISKREIRVYYKDMAFNFVVFDYDIGLAESYKYHFVPLGCFETPESALAMIKSYDGNDNIP